ncbi:3-oxo-5-alpha-steroid 4-dehydrogenase family protein [Brugia pahangi]
MNSALKMTSIAVEVFDAKNINKSIAYLENITSDESIVGIKSRLSQKLSLPINQIALRLDAKGKNLKDELVVLDLNLPSKGAHLYIRVLGPQIGWKTVFLLEYIGPLVIYPIFYLRPTEIYGPDASRYPMSYGVKLALVCWSFHYAKRLLETLFVHRFSNATMPLRNIFKNCGYYWAFTAFVSYFINHPLYTLPYFGFVQVATGLIGFIICEFGNLSVHLLLRNLRPSGTKVRKIPIPDINPMTLMFHFVSCPNYTYEVGSWLWFSYMTQSLPALIFTFAGFLQMAIWAKDKHRNYRREFPNYPKHRRAMIPFTMASQALQAVVLCGGLGNRMTSLTDHIPKCMLPIAGVPMFWYPLNFLQKNSIKEVVMVVAERLMDEIRHLLFSSALPSLDNLQIEFIKLSSAAEHWGTADVLRFINAQIKKDFIVVSGDFVSDVNLAPMLSLHAAENAILTCLLCDRVITGPAPGPKMKLLKERDFIVLSKNNQLLFSGSEEDYDDTVTMNVDLLDKCRTAYFTAKYSDCHLYIMKKYILNIIDKHRQFTSLKADLIPYILEKQNTKDSHELTEYVRIDPLDEKIQKFSFGANAVKNLQYRLKCFAYLLPPENGFIVGHVNTIGSYFEINKAIIRFLSSSFSEKFSVGQLMDDIGTTSNSECYIGPTTRLFLQSATEAHIAGSERPIIKRSVIGDKCVVGPRSKIISSVLMDECQIGAGAQITNSIICAGAEIGENANISSSIVVCQQVVSASAKVHNELVVPNSEVELEKWTEEIW